MRHILILLLLSAFVASPALAQTPCGPTAQMEKFVIEKYGEAPIGIGRMGESMTASITVNPVTGTFSVLVRRPGDITCIIMGGTGFTEIPQVDPKQPET
jgi:hypothetical protein